MYQVPEAKKKTFEFQFEGKTYSIPAYESLPMEMLIRFTRLVSEVEDEQAQKLKAMDAAFEIFDTYVPGLLGRMDAEQTGALIAAYMSDAAPAKGESQASSD